jgi:Zn-dependent protease with chaperone function
MKRYVIFAAVGPFVGGFLLLLTTTIMSGYLHRAALAEFGKLVAVFFKTLQYSYLFGILPSLMLGAIDDIVYHVKRVTPLWRALLVGLVAFATTEFIYGSRGPDSGMLQFVMYGLVGFIPATISSWLAHKFADEPQPRPAS